MKSTIFLADTAQRQKWLVIFNCQAMGLSNCLRLLCNRIDVESYDQTTFKQNEVALLGRLDQFDRIIVAPWVEAHFGIDFAQRPNLWRLPSFFFSGYHPDHCNLSNSETRLGGPLTGNFSALSYAAFRCGLDEGQARLLYRDDVFAALGYFDHWDAQKQNLLQRYADAGFDVASAFAGWSRRGPFTYFPPNPKVFCIADLARAVLNKAGMEPLNTEALPHDNMANGVRFPVYPEIGARLGVRGDYFFKAGNDYRLMGLEEFLSATFTFFRASSDLAHPKQFDPLVQRAIGVIQAKI